MQKKTNQKRMSELWLWMALNQMTRLSTCLQHWLKISTPTERLWMWVWGVWQKEQHSQRRSLAMRSYRGEGLITGGRAKSPAKEWNQENSWLTEVRVQTRRNSQQARRRTRTPDRGQEKLVPGSKPFREVFILTRKWTRSSKSCKKLGIEGSRILWKSTWSSTIQTAIPANSWNSVTATLIRAMTQEVSLISSPLAPQEFSRAGRILLLLKALSRILKDVSWNSPRTQIP